MIKWWSARAPVRAPPSHIGDNPASASVIILVAPEVYLRLTRRSVVCTGVLAVLSPILDRFGAPCLGASARAQEQALEWKHGLSLFGELKYPAGFKHFDYVNPSAPKGGSVRLMALGT